MAEITNYKCTSCGGSLKFSSTKQKLICTSCGTEFEVSEFDSTAAASGEVQYQAKKDEWDVHGEGLVVLVLAIAIVVDDAIVVVRL